LVFYKFCNAIDFKFALMNCQNRIGNGYNIDLAVLKLFLKNWPFLDADTDF
jgi:hypothetical protein